MPGVFGGNVTGEGLTSTVDAAHRTRGNEDQVHESGPFGLGLRHNGATDPGGHTWWADGKRAGGVYGAVVNGDDLGWSVADLFGRVLDRPRETLRALDGPFVLAAFDADAERYVLATDRLGTRTLYYRTDEFRFGSELHPLVAENDRVDPQAMSDVLFLGNVWGEKTLVEAVRSLPPATYLTYEAGEVERARYWRPTLDPAAADRTYLRDLARAYRRAVEATASTLPGTVGMFLSGGLDSRTMAGELRRNADRGAFGSLKAYTYDSNPPRSGNPELAERIGDTLDIDVRRLELAPGPFLDVLDEAVSRTDGMVNWQYLFSPATAFQIPEGDRHPMLEACGQGELLGELPYRYHLRECSVTEAFRRTDAVASEARVRAVLAGDVDPFDTVRTLAARSDEAGRRRVVLDIHYANHYSRGHMASTELYRSAMGSRIPFAHGEFLDHVTRLPLAYRLGTVPLSRGRVPYDVSRPKLDLVRRLSPELAAIPYERTRLSPDRPKPLHTVGYGINKTRELLDRRFGPPAPDPDTWYRRDAAFRSRIDELVDDAVTRRFVDEGTIRRLQRDQVRGDGDNMWVLAAVTTLELWLARHFDDPERGAVSGDGRLSRTAR